ncbi:MULTISPECIES: hypothetical protein [unclassified Halomonas]|uniref:hypothetical protein n=1 Tax=unclassified Halomonas TaxID=2609666 RepID=UPI001C9638B6|nr:MULTISPECIES: hypothetical protein [unclassified Halomonas]MBY5924715.1 hypothetical protein [Halomonas sp. DP4Y7-2]MBY6231757.1 hypothetical protein [Halomonas sp. DP4Y7-1]
MSATTADLATLLGRLPVGYSDALFRGQRYGVTLKIYNAGRSLKLLAQQLGGTDMVSLNAYLTGSEWRLKPCEMSERKVLNFLAEAQPLPRIEP